VDTCLELVEEARRDGVDVMTDAFPYTCGNTTILAPFPYWFLAGQPEAYNSFWARTRLRAELGVGLRLQVFPTLPHWVSSLEFWEPMPGIKVFSGLITRSCA
jgi:hypothetical protein